MKITRIGNLLLPWIDSWMNGYRHVTSGIYKSKPIPDNVLYLRSFRVESNRAIESLS